MSDVIECAFYISIDHPWPCGVGPCQAKNFLDRVVTSSARAKAVADPLEASFPKGLQGVFHHGLDTSINDGGNAKRAVAVPLGDIDPTDRMNLVKIERAKLMAQCSSLFRCRYHDVIDAGCRLAAVHLGDAPNAVHSVRFALQHQSLQRPDTCQVAGS